ncbi:LOW QUALITY PROTEIN: putative ferric-chelate reductase 1 homolog [Lepeophtheirus salmonis]|uniref:LOW QUALITY PROTEIN: putative ferric-chelate reductase 1 homolog n=1 Tax=Lepeophtheirus salmonis TaxID=72036 RepID=UPI001AE37C61|nr:LOW QUALITY PROTEIN: putative ferric-chelate reductase 1 homolog [Lepeophtheirus salmonis]
MSRIIKLLPFLFLRVHTYSNGPPVRACKSMIPEHDGGGSLSTDTPYTLAVSDKYLKSGETLKLKFARSGNLDFRGFLIQARDQNSDKIIGTFTSIDRTTTRRLHCLSERDPPDAISHTTGEPKSSITATWTAPEFYGQENRTAVFYFTVVYSQNIFWARRNSGIRIHISPKVIDQQKLKSEETAAAAQELPSPYLGCGTKKGCFGFPGRNCVEESSCKGLFTHKYLEKNKRFNFALAGEVEENGYIAAGFSHGDSIMGDDIIISCRKTARGGVIALGWNDGRNSVDRQMGLNIRNYEIRENNGMMICKFQVNDELIISKATLNDKLKVDLKEDSQYYLLLAKGSLSSDGTKLSKHMDKSATSNPIDFKSTTIVKAGSYILYQLHGIFMVIAWLGCSSMGMLIARYYKNTWTKIQIADKDLWFVIHQILMITALVLSLLAAIFILSKAGFFPYDSKFISNNPHPVIGGLTIGLSLIQPIMGALRPTRGTRFRPYFNIGHWFLGNVIYILAVTTIFLSVDLDNARLPPYTSYVLLSFFIIHIIFHIGLSIQSHMIDEDTNKIADSQGNMRQDSRRDQVGAICRKLSLVGYFFFCVCYCTVYDCGHCCCSRKEWLTFRANVY